MFGLFRRSSRNAGAKPSIDSVRFDTAGYAFRGEPEPGKVRAWDTPEGDVLSVTFYLVHPDLPGASVDELAAHYHRSLAGSNCRLVENRVVAAGGYPALRTIVSVPQQPFGRTYLGALTLPLLDFGFVFKCQCHEHGLTGTKGFILLMPRLQALGPTADIGGAFGADWNPDAPDFDAKFPHHPVARARRAMDHLEGSLTLAAEIRELPGVPQRDRT